MSVRGRKSGLKSLRDPSSRSGYPHSKTTRVLFMRYGLCVLMLLASALFGAEVKVTGVVTGADGKPAANVELSTWWSNWKGDLKPDGGVKSGADGSFSLTVELEGSIPPALFAMDAERKFAALKVLNSNPEQKADLKLEPVVKVGGKFDCPEMGIPFEGYTIEGQVKAMPSGSPFMQSGRSTKEFTILLPSGSFAFDNSTADTISREYPFEVNAGAADLDVGVVNLEPTPIARHYKKTPPPLSVTDVRNGQKDLTLAQYKGKHVLVIYWALWCTPCITGALPEAMDFYEKNEALRGKFEIIGVHEPGVKTWDAYDAKKKTVVEKIWKGKEPKFPMVLDASGKTYKDYAIKLLPTDMLIDPDGNVMPHGSLANLKKALGLNEK
jgi:thiol-disulfide isomerase/thioredoxin